MKAPNIKSINRRQKRKEKKEKSYAFEPVIEIEEGSED